ncbi:MAG TPA: branched-chain amino acid ABC transporter substrate-binding protein [Terriglobia bacterium]|nr:branched-chain amino acid ABC transporter substrate-binding protein [Terriglobia bacterium]
MSITGYRCLSQAALAALCLGLAGCATPQPRQSASNDEIVIGVAGPMSGDLSDFGEQERWGAKTAVADINAAGGLLGKRLRPEIGDDRCDPGKAREVANDMVEMHAALVVGHFCSGSSIPASSIYAAHQIVQITPSSTNPRLTEEGSANGWTTLFRVISPDDRQAIFAANWVSKKYPHGRIAVLNDGSSYGGIVSDRFLETLKAAGITPVYTSTYQQRTSDFSDIVTGFQKNQPDLVYIGGYHNDFALIVKQARAAGIKAEFAGADALNTSEFASIAGSATNGVRFTDQASAVDTAAASKVTREIRAEGYEPEGYTLASYAAVQAWAAGVTRAGTTDSLKVAAAMRSTPVETVLGKLSWDSKGDIEQMRYAWFIWHGDRYAQEYGN